MAIRERRRDRALAVADRIRAEIGAQVRSARRSSGASVRAAAASVSMDFSALARIERAELRSLTVEQLALACVAVGLTPTVRAFPDGDAVRDAGQRRLVERFRARLPPDARLELEVPLPTTGDLRSLDALFRMGGELIGVEAETVLYDLQAQQRRAMLKKRDARLDRLILLVADTERNRRVLAEHRESLRIDFPFDTRAVMRSLVAGQPPSADAIVVL